MESLTPSSCISTRQSHTAPVPAQGHCKWQIAPALTPQGSGLPSDPSLGAPSLRTLPRAPQAGLRPGGPSARGLTSPTTPCPLQVVCGETVPLATPGVHLLDWGLLDTPFPLLFHSVTVSLPRHWSGAGWAAETTVVTAGSLASRPWTLCRAALGAVKAFAGMG